MFVNLLIVVIKLLFIEIILYLCNRLRRNLNRTFMELKLKYFPLTVNSSELWI